MTATQTQIRRDTAGNLATSTPALAELGYDITNKRILVGDGSALGGIPHTSFMDAQNNTFTQVTAGGTGNAITLTLLKAPSSYVQGLGIYFKASANNTSAVTVNVNGLGVKNLQKISGGALGALVSGDIVSGGMYLIVYDGTQFQLQTLTNAGVTSVSQGDLNTATGSVTLFLTGTGVPTVGAMTALPGGEYGFCPTIASSSAGESLVGFRNTGGTQISSVAILSISINVSAVVDQRYITSSPPFDLGDGDVGGFIYVLLNNAGDVVGHYAADVPPWAYNGPTKIRCDWKCPMTGKKYRRIKEQRTITEIMDGAQPVYSMQEITMDIKNADMNLIPHPFLNYGSGLTPVLLDPMDERVKRLIDAQNDGDDYIVEAIKGGHIKVNNDAMTNRSNPTGCPIHRMTFRYGGK